MALSENNAKRLEETIFTISNNARSGDIIKHQYELLKNIFGDDADLSTNLISVVSTITASEFQAIVNTAAPTQTILMYPGTYSFTSEITLVPDTKIVMLNGATFTDRAFRIDTPGKYRISGKGSFIATGSVPTLHIADIVSDNVDVEFEFEEVNLSHFLIRHFGNNGIISLKGKIATTDSVDGFGLTVRGGNNKLTVDIEEGLSAHYSIIDFRNNGADLYSGDTYIQGGGIKLLDAGVYGNNSNFKNMIIYSSGSGVDQSTLNIDAPVISENATYAGNTNNAAVRTIATLQLSIFANYPNINVGPMHFATLLGPSILHATGSITSEQITISALNTSSVVLNGALINSITAECINLSTAANEAILSGTILRTGAANSITGLGTVRSLFSGSNAAMAGTVVLSTAPASFDVNAAL